MRAMILEKNGPIESSPLQMREVPEPVPGPGEVRVKVRCCAICRTDLHVVEGDLPVEKMPVIVGHQAIGLVDRIGPGCTELHAGERVGIAWLRHTDGTCRFCAVGRENLCPSSRYAGYHADGAGTPSSQSCRRRSPIASPGSSMMSPRRRCCARASSATAR